MKIHPEMQETVKAEMTEGLRYWRDKSPEEINKQMRARMVTEQRALIGAPTGGLAWKQEYKGCTCGGQLGHYPWCDGKMETILFTPEVDSELKKKNFFTGHSPWGGV